MRDLDPSNSVSTFDPTKHFVRLTQVRADGFVEFEFAIGDTELAVEPILPADASGTSHIGFRTVRNEGRARLRSARTTAPSTSREDS
jgi:Phenol hydroxylase subunit